MALGEAWVDLHANVDPFERETIVGVEKTRAMAEAIFKAIPVHAKVDFDIDRNSLKRDSAQIGSAFGADIAKGIASALSLGTGNPYIGAAVLALAAALAPVLGAAITSGIGLALGGGIIGSAILALKDNAKLKAAAEKTFTSIGNVFTRAAQPLLGPFINALEGIAILFKGLEPVLKSIFTAAKPILDSIAGGFGGFLTNLLTGVRDSMPGIVAAFTALGDALPGVGTAIGDFFKQIFGNEDLVQRITGLLITMVNGFFKIAGPLVQGLTVIFGAFANTMRAVFGTMHLGIGSLLEFITNLKGGQTAINNITAAFGPWWLALRKVWDALVAFAAANTDKEIGDKWVALLSSLSNAWDKFKKFVTAVWDSVWLIIKQIFAQKVIPWWEGTVKPWLINQVQNLMGTIFKNAVDKAVSWVKGLPGRVISALAGLPGQLLNLGLRSGASLINGLVSGLSSRLGVLRDIAGVIAATIARTLPGSPAKEGPLSGQGYTKLRGERAVGDLAAGLMSGIPNLRMAAAQVAGSTFSTNLNFYGQQPTVNQAKTLGRAAASALDEQISLRDTTLTYRMA